MGKIVKNGITYGGKSTSAGNISYDNTTSELQSQTVQNAITELKDLVDENTGNDVGRFEKDNQGNVTGEIFNTYTGDYKNIASGIASHAEGYGTQASGEYSHAEGAGTTASSRRSHAEGSNTTASGYYSHAEGNNTTASDYAAHAEGGGTTAGYAAHAEGLSTEASGNYSHAEGEDTIASGFCSHAGGFATIASGDQSHAEGWNTIASGDYSHAGGYYTIANNDYQTVIGKYNIADIVPEDSGGCDSDSCDSDTPVPQYPKHLFIIGNGEDDDHRSNIVEVTEDTFNVNGDITVAGKPLVVQCETMSTADEYLLGRIVQYVGVTDANYTHGWFYECVSDGEEPPTYSWEEKVISPSPDQVGHFEYDQSGNITGEIFNTYTGNDKNIASSSGSHAEGNGTTASGLDSHAEGYATIASGNYGSHAEGSDTVASGDHSHAENHQTTASNYSAHAEGSGTVASGYASHAEGAGTAASGNYSHAGGYHTEAKTEYSTVIGKYNRVDGTGVSDPKHLFIIGNGASDYTHSNIVEVSETYMNVNGEIKQNSVPLRATTMPTITASMLGKVVQYVGVSDSNYKQGWNYVAVSDGAQEPTYSWQALMDNSPTSGSTNAVTSDGIYAFTNPFRTWRNGSGTTSAIGGAVGYNTASGTRSLAWGDVARATGVDAIAMGKSVTASGAESLALGLGTVANQPQMISGGKYNQVRVNDLLEIGNGTADNARSNIVEVNTTSLNVNGDIQRNSVPIYPLVYDAATESYIFSGLNS